MFIVFVSSYNGNYNINSFSPVNRILLSDIANKTDLQTREYYQDLLHPGKAGAGLHIVSSTGCEPSHGVWSVNPPLTLWYIV